MVLKGTGSGVTPRMVPFLNDLYSIKMVRYRVNYARLLFGKILIFTFIVKIFEFSPATFVCRVIPASRPKERDQAHLIG